MPGNNGTGKGVATEVSTGVVRGPCGPGSGVANEDALGESLALNAGER